MYTFTLYDVLQFCLSFPRSLLLYFLANLMVFLSLENWKFTEISSLYSPPWLTRFPVAKMSKLERGRNKNMDIIIVSSCTWLSTSSLQWELERTTATAFFSTFLVVFFKHCKHYQPWLPNHQINTIFSNILSLDSPPNNGLLKYFGVICTIS